MANITKIKAKDPSAPKKPEKSEKAEKAEKVQKTNQPIKPTKSDNPVKPSKKPFFLFRPFIALGRYLRDSWREIRQVRWPSRKATWKMFLAVLIYTALFIALITLLDVLFSWLFNTIIL